MLNRKTCSQFDLYRVVCKAIATHDWNKNDLEVRVSFTVTHKIFTSSLKCLTKFSSSLDQMSLQGAKMLSECTTGGHCWAGTGLFHVDADRIIFTLGGYIFGKCGQGGKASSSHDSAAPGLHGPRHSNMIHTRWNETPGRWGGTGWVMSVLSPPVTHCYKYILHLMNVLYRRGPAISGNATVGGSINSVKCWNVAGELIQLFRQSILIDAFSF